MSGMIKVTTWDEMMNEIKGDLLSCIGCVTGGSERACEYIYNSYREIYDCDGDTGYGIISSDCVNLDDLDDKTFDKFGSHDWFSVDDLNEIGIGEISREGMVDWVWFVGFFDGFSSRWDVYESIGEMIDDLGLCNTSINVHTYQDRESNRFYYYGEVIDHIERDGKTWDSVEVYFQQLGDGKSSLGGEVVCEFVNV